MEKFKIETDNWVRVRDGYNVEEFTLILDSKFYKLGIVEKTNDRPNEYRVTILDKDNTNEK